MGDIIHFGLGCIPSPVDTRDIKFGVSVKELKPIDLSNEFPPIRNQGRINSCTSFATTDLFWFVRKKQGLRVWEPSQLFTYYGARLLGNFVNEDSGAYIRDALKSAAKDGVSRDELWPYDGGKVFERPVEAAWKDAETHQALQYQSLNNTKEELLGCLSEGYPFVFGAVLYESFIKSQVEAFMTGPVPLPDMQNEKIVGGHAMLAVGWYAHPQNSDNIFIIARNSWGTNLGFSGYHHIPLSYFLNTSLCFDMWTIRKVEVAPEDSVPAPLPKVDPKPQPQQIEDEKVSIWKRPMTYSLLITGLIFLCIFVVPLIKRLL